jgi:hypothetical protein
MLEAGYWIKFAAVRRPVENPALDQDFVKRKHELRVSRASICRKASCGDTSIDNLKRNWLLVTIYY